MAVQLKRLSKKLVDRPGFHAGLLLLWCGLGLALRLLNLTAKPPWMDEVSTVVFSLGNSTRLIPLNQVIGLDELLRPIQLQPDASIRSVIHFLLEENNHPPAYFVLAHSWMRWLIQPDGYASLWAARSLPAFFGALAVPATFGLAWAAFRSRLVAHLCAALMMASPFAVFLAQEARHYTLAIFWVTLSLGCLAIAVRAIRQRQPLPLSITGLWVGANGLAIATHYFSGLTLLAEGLVLLGMAWQQRRSWHDWAAARRRIYLVAIGTLVGGVVWLPVWMNFYGSPQSSFLKGEPHELGYWLNPVAQSLAGWIYAILTPMTVGYRWWGLAAVIISILVSLAYLCWLMAQLIPSLRHQLWQPDRQIGLAAVGGFFLAANGLFFAICYLAGQDITRGHRYSFVFFSALIVLVGAGLAPFWEGKAPRFTKVRLPLIQRAIGGRQFVVLAICCSLIGSLFVVFNLSFQKYYRADRLIPLMQATSAHPVIIGTPTLVTAQPTAIGIEMMSLAWEIKRHFNPATDPNWQAIPKFMVLEQNTVTGLEPTGTLIQLLTAQTRPLDLWLFNYGPDLTAQGCHIPSGGYGHKGSFSYNHYVCGAD